jgi:hypothetical protein
MNNILKDINKIILEVEERLSDKIKCLEDKIDCRFSRLEEKVRLLTRVRKQKQEKKQEIKISPANDFRKFRVPPKPAEEYIEKIFEENGEHYYKNKICFIRFIEHYFANDKDCNIIFNNRLYICKGGTWSQLERPGKTMKIFFDNVWKAYKAEVELTLDISPEETDELLPKNTIKIDIFRKIITKVSGRSKMNRV